MSLSNIIIEDHFDYIAFNNKEILDDVVLVPIYNYGVLMSPFSVTIHVSYMSM